jgi:hypothetical protein
VCYERASVQTDGPHVTSKRLVAPAHPARRRSPHLPLRLVAAWYGGTTGASPLSSCVSAARNSGQPLKDSIALSHAQPTFRHLAGSWAPRAAAYWATRSIGEGFVGACETLLGGKAASNTLRDPTTGERLSRPNPSSQHKRGAAPSRFCDRTRFCGLDGANSGGTVERWERKA